MWVLLDLWWGIGEGTMEDEKERDREAIAREEEEEEEEERVWKPHIP